MSIKNLEPNVPWFRLPSWYYTVAKVCLILGIIFFFIDDYFTNVMNIGPAFPLWHLFMFSSVILMLMSLYHLTGLVWQSSVDREEEKEEEP